MQGDRPGAAMTRICMQRAAATAHFCVHPAKIHYTGIITYACLFWYFNATKFFVDLFLWSSPLKPGGIAKPRGASLQVPYRHVVIQLQGISGELFDEATFP
jgi:hypothetical protein